MSNLPPDSLASEPPVAVPIEPPDSAESRCLAAVVHGQAKTLAALLNEQQALCQANPWICAALGDTEGLRRHLARNPASAKTLGGQWRAEPLAYVCLGKLGGDDAARATCAELLLAHGAVPNATWFDENWPSSRLPILYAATGRGNYPQLARVLLKAGAKTNDGESIYHAAEHNHRECLEALAEAGADFSRRQDPWGNTPLFFLLGHQPNSAAAGPAGEGIRWLLDHGADPNVSSYVATRDETPLPLVVTQGWPVELAAKFIAHGADIHRPRKDGRTPLTLAVRYGRVEIETLLRSHGAKDETSALDQLLGACWRRDANAARALLAAQPGLIHEVDKAVVIEAAREGRAEALALMSELGFDLTVTGTDGATALHYAAWQGWSEAMQVLLRAGASVEAVEPTYQATPLGWCLHGSLNCQNSQGDYAACAEALLAGGAQLPAAWQGSPAVMAVIKGRTSNSSKQPGAPGPD